MINPQAYTEMSRRLAIARDFVARIQPASLGYSEAHRFASWYIDDTTRLQSQLDATTRALAKGEYMNAEIIAEMPDVTLAEVMEEIHSPR